MARTNPPRVRTAGLLALVVALAAGCGDDGGTATGCGPQLREALDPAYLVHVLDDGAPQEYTSDPPTSGPHKPSPPDTGVVDRVLSRPIQVGILERGDVLIQYDPDLPAADRADLEALAGDQVVVAPNPELPTTVVATAWVYKQTCATVDVAALEDFVAEREGHGPT
jgi:Protein of unknown function (DUF3105)